MRKVAVVEAPPFTKSRLLSVGIFFARSPSIGAVPGTFLLSGLASKTQFSAPSTRFSVSILCRALERSMHTASQNQGVALVRLRKQSSTRHRSEQ